MKKLLVLALALLSVAGMQAEKAHWNRTNQWKKHGFYTLGQPVGKEQNNEYGYVRCEKCGHKIRIHFKKPKPIHFKKPKPIHTHSKPGNIRDYLGWNDQDQE